MKLWKILIIVLAIILFIIGGYFIYKHFWGTGEQENTISEEVAIPEEILNNKFGFLSGGEPENSFVEDVGAAWVE